VYVYEWVHVFECLLRAGQLAAVDIKSVVFRPPHSSEHRWSDLARRRMRADYLRVTGDRSVDLGSEYQQLLEAYDRGGLPYERALTRLSYVAWLSDQGRGDEAASVQQLTVQLARQYRMPVIEADAWHLGIGPGRRKGKPAQIHLAEREVARLQAALSFQLAPRP
jgi:hypothetical protein